MKRILIFAGTTEGRKLAELLSKSGIEAVVCVATEYGTQVMKPLPGILLHEGRMNRKEMQEFMKNRGFCAVIDATHPFAAEASENIRESAGRQQIQYLRLQRNTRSEYENAENQIWFSESEDCAEALTKTRGNILLTTGSKELSVYCARETLRERLYVRVLPSEESIRLCKEHGISGRQVIAMQGPFSEEMNTALLKQYQIRHLVTKESGRTGGFEEKISAAQKAEVRTYVIGNPEKQKGLSFAEICENIEAVTGMRVRRERRLQISLIGIGMGNTGTLTMEARERIADADVLFGAKRLLSCVEVWQAGKQERKTYPYYLAENIIPVLEEVLSVRRGVEEYEKKTAAVVLFSGDSGFYSGSQKLYQKLSAWKKGRTEEIDIRVCPGISSVSYFAASCGMSWQDARILSVHGKGAQKNWEAEVLNAVKYEKKVFLLVSGVRDVQAIGTILDENGMEDCRILLGYQLSYPEEEIIECTPEECRRIEKEGLYILGILNGQCAARYLTPQKRDAEFIRGTVPMTKEEIRELSVCKLKLTEEAVVYDIGSGTGSVAVEIAEQSEKIRVYAIEQKPEGVALIGGNRKKFRLSNLEIVHGKAPECIEELPIPTHAFIGGSGGSLKEILDVLYEKNHTMRVVITAVTLETVGEITELLKGISAKEKEMIQVQVSRARQAGHYHLMQAENPVYIFSFDFVEREGLK